MSITSRIQALIDAGNEITGESSTDLTSVVQDLIDGYGSGTRYTITYTLATNMESSNTATRVTEGNSYTTTISSSDSDYQVDEITVTMGGTDVTSTVLSDSTITIDSVTGNVVITVTAVYYPAVVTDVSTLSITSEGTATLGVALHAEPTQSQTVALYSEDLTLSSTELTFTTSDWDTYQYVTVTAGEVDVTTYQYITLTNSDPMLTESTIMATVSPVGYSDLVDTTIDTTDQHTLTADDFTSTSTYTYSGTTYLRLFGYCGSYTNVLMPATMDGYPTITLAASSSPSASNTTFASNTTIQYVTFEDGCIIGEGGAPLGNSGSGAFYGCTSLIGISNFPTACVKLANTFNGCTALKFIDNLDELVNVTTINQAFLGSGIEYVQDLSGWTALAIITAAFKNCTSLIKMFGFPALASSAAATNMYAGCTALKYAIIPEGTSAATYCCYNCTSLTRCDIYEDSLSTSGITSTTFYNCSGLTVYCNADTTTYESLASVYGSSTSVTIMTFGSSSSLPSIVVWGDSISSPNKAWVEWPARLQTQLGTSDYLVKNEALAGEWSTSTTARQGGYAMTASEFTIPADTTATEFTITVNGTETFGYGGTDASPNAGTFSAGASFNPCTISGVSGTISRSSSTYYFTRLEAGTAVSVSDGASIASDNDATFNASGNVMLFYLNGNAGWHSDADVLLEMFQDAVDHFTSLGGTMYIVAGPAANSILTNSTTMAEVQSFESMAETAFGDHWLNLREYEITYGLDQNGLTASDLDTERMAAGLVPASLVGGGSEDNILMYDGETVTDQNHPNVYGANTIMLAFYEKGQALGYWS